MRKTLQQELTFPNWEASVRNSRKGSKTRPVGSLAHTAANYGVLIKIAEAERALAVALQKSTSPTKKLKPKPTRPTRRQMREHIHR